MPKMFMELWMIFHRSIIMYVVALIVMRLMGKREIGKLSPFDLVVAIMVAELAAMPMEDLKIPLINAIFPLLIVMALEIILALVTLKSERLREILTGKPLVLIQNGQILDKEMRRARYNVNDLLTQLRQQKVPNIKDVEFAVLETSGNLTVIPRADKRPIEPADLRIPVKYEGLPVPLITDGRIHRANLKKHNLDEAWLMGKLLDEGIENPAQVTLASFDPQGHLYISPKQKMSQDVNKDKPKS